MVVDNQRFIYLNADRPLKAQGYVVKKGLVCGRSKFPIKTFDY